MEPQIYTLQEEVELTKKILADPGATIPALFFNSVDRLICKILRRKEPFHWWVSVLVLALASQAPTLLISYFFNEMQLWKAYKIGYIWMGYILLGLFAIVIARFGIFYLFNNLNKNIVATIQREGDLEDLRKILTYVWSREGSIKKVTYFTLAFTAFWCISFSSIYSGYLGVKFIGYGLFSGTIVFGLLTGPALYMEAWFFLFILHIGTYKFHLNETAPVYSETVQRISKTVTILLYSFAVFIAFSTAAVSFDPVTGNFNPGAVLLVTLIGWIPTTIYFIGSQISINRIVTSAKWRTLSRIQEEIEKLHNGDLTDKGNIEAINRLMDYHMRIRTSPDSTLSIGTGLNFVNQLALPFIGVFLANINNIRNFFYPP
jgi:hypothetical protein